MKLMLVPCSTPGLALSSVAHPHTCYNVSSHAKAAQLARSVCGVFADNAGVLRITSNVGPRASAPARS